MLPDSRGWEKIMILRTIISVFLVRAQQGAGSGLPSGGSPGGWKSVDSRTPGYAHFVWWSDQVGQ